MLVVVWERRRRRELRIKQVKEDRSVYESTAEKKGIESQR